MTSPSITRPKQKSIACSIARCGATCNRKWVEARESLEARLLCFLARQVSLKMHAVKGNVLVWSDPRHTESRLTKL